MIIESFTVVKATAQMVTPVDLNCISHRPIS